MTKSITDLAREAGFPFNKYGLLQGDGGGEIDANGLFTRFASLHRASIIESLTREMPKPHDSVPLIGGDGKEIGRKDRYTADQLREYAAGLVAKAIAKERELLNEASRILNEARRAIGKIEVERTRGADYFHAEVDWLVNEKENIFKLQKAIRARGYL